MAVGTRTIRVKFDGDVRGLKKAAADGERSVSGFGDKFVKLGDILRTALGGLAAIGIVSIAGEIKNLSSRIEDLDRKARIVFEDQLGDIQKWAEANRRAFGMSAREVTGLAANLADLLKPMGFTAKQAADMSKKTLDLAGALSKWSGGARTTAEVADILSAAFLGERDALQGLGISITQAEVNARLLAKGQKDLAGTALQQAEALATQELIWEKSTDAQKAWAEGGRAAAEAQGTLASSIETLKEKLAILLTPAIQAATTAIGGFADQAVAKFDQVAPRVQTFINTELSGLMAVLNELKDKTLAGVKRGFDDISTSIDANRESWRNLTKDIEGSLKILGPVFQWLAATIGTAVGAALDWLASLYTAIRKLVQIVDALVRNLDRLPGNLSGGGVNVEFGKISGRQHGGPVRAGQSVMVGEEEAEIFTPGASGFVTPMSKALGRGSGGWGPKEIVVPIYIGDEVARVVRYEIKESNRSLRRAVLAGAGAR